MVSVLEKSDNCIICGGEKRILLNIRQPQTGLVSQKICNGESYRNMHNGAWITEVWCNQCGVKYHTDSI
jgi:transcription elongation factor Elf1